MEKIDPLTRNLILETSSATEYFKWYGDTLQTAFKQIDASSIERSILLLKETVRSGGQVFISGNGGSAAISDHLCCDWTKGTAVPALPPLKTRSLASNVALLTALANDLDYKSVFSWQLEKFAGPKDVLLVISSSGNSPNIVEAVETARKLGIRSIAMTGFTGGKVGKRVDIHLHVPVENYGIVEDCHQMLMHMIAQYLAQDRTNHLTNPLMEVA